ncbi:MAG: insulinase family protein, partial [Pseudomonadota bacterium]
MKVRAFSGAVLGCVGLACAAPAPKPAATPAAAPTATAPAPATPAAAAAVTPPAPRITPDAPFREQAPGAGPEQPYHPPHWTRFKLKNGLEVFLVEFHDLPLVDFNLVVKTGSAANPSDKAGLADLTARMLVEGTKTRGALEIADQVAALGATLVSGSTWEASSAGLSTLTKNLDAAL